LLFYAEVACMGLRLRTLLAGGVIITLLVVMTFVALSAILSQSFTELEKRQSELNAQRVVKALEQQLRSQLSSTKDYAEWDATYDFVASQDPAYLEDNYDLTVYQNLNVSLLMILDLQNQVIMGQAFDLDAGLEQPLTENIRPHIQAGKPLVSIPNAESTLTGFLILPEGPLMVTGNPILRNNGKGEPDGVLIMARWLDTTTIADLSNRTSLTVHVYLYGRDALSPEAQSATKTLEIARQQPGFPFAFVPRDGKIAYAYTELRDIYGVPSLLVEVVIPREIYQEGQSSLNWMLAILILIGLTFGPIMAFLLEAHVLRPVLHLSRGVAEIAATGDLSKTISIRGKDEIGTLTKNVNTMLLSLSQTQNELKDAKDIAEHANRAKDMLLAQVSHELRTPLSAILGYTELLYTEVLGPLLPQQKKASAQVLDSTRHLTGLVNDLLDQAQMDRGAFRLYYAPFAPRTLMDQVMTELTPQAERKGLRLIAEIMPEIPDDMVGDVRRLQQIITNLVNNAIKFTEKGEVSVRFFVPSPGHWAIQVADTGPGIPAESREIIFEPFKQVDNTITRKQKGYGLGLAIVKRLAIQMGGEVYLDSELGKGSSFTVLLLIEPPEGETITQNL
ncbi:MAG TPA: CHASE4 domain-containing protein, partial [Anaerolineaceae bacterium]|nr:CHASE4 domain-containing protein [Anaerolineaceae bacterium]